MRFWTFGRIMALAICVQFQLSSQNLQYHTNKQERSGKSPVPKKIRELKSLLLKAGFTYEPGKGSHTKWSHILLPSKVTLSGKDGSDAKSYQERDVNNALKQLAKIQKENEQ